MDESQLKLDNQICFPIYSASKLITKVYKTHLNKLNITYPQYLVLLVLWENDHLPISNISKKLLLDTNTLSPMLQRMESSDLLVRTKDKNDARIVIISLKKKGKVLKEKAAHIPNELEKTVLSEDINQEELLQVKHTLDTLINIITNRNNK